LSDTAFTNGVTLSDSDWFNDVNRLHYTIFGDPATAIAALDALKIKGADKASGATVDLSNATGDFVHITGVTTITAITLSSGDERTVVFDGILTLTHNGTSLILPGAANITTAAGDIAVFRGDGGGNVRCLSYFRGASFYATTAYADAIGTIANKAAITYVFDGGGSVLTTGIKGDLSIPFACTITGNRLLADQSGSIVVDIWKDTYANYPPTVADTITASAKPTITTATKSEDTTLTGWTTTIAAGDTLRFNIDSITTIQRAVLTLKVTKT